MVKPKQRHIRSAPGKKRQNQRSTETDPPDDEDWMVVKKQRITILIPPLPNKCRPRRLMYEKARYKKSQEIPIPSHPRRPTPSCNIHRVSVPKQSAHETEKSISLPQEQADHHPVTVHPSEPNLTLQKPSSLSYRIASDNSPHRSFRDNMGIGKCSTSRGHNRMMIYADSSAFLDPRMRASYLEKKLKKAGGLENWLVSLGLTRFVKVFQRRSITKFQLANLTMKKLKDMGTDAVGPRRKLMHAINCLCEPHCFQHH
ncbi:UNVERIFIED_CONTAM: hypothetical protein Scaly_1709700 [Sesamum calycinum]|uniref:SAM domain-containing protein n=1 Tax=Sesamum calycinum TaxID=2727403 RepID=A0AAW2NSW5_9LAMI